MIQVIWNGRLGNQLFEYSIGRILAEELGYELISNPISYFPGTHEHVSGKRIEPIHVLRGQVLDMDFILANKDKLGFQICGWFQRYEYYKNHKDKIKKWFEINSNVTAPNKNDVVIHLRRTQFGIDNLVAFNVNGSQQMLNSEMLSFEWYDNILKNLSFNKLFICTDVQTDPFLNHFNKYRPIITNMNEIDDFCFIKKANRIIMSASSYSWWTAYLSNAEEIFMPRPNYGCWTYPRPFPDVDLMINDDSRYKLIDAKKEGTFI